MKISVVLAIYNEEDNLRACLESIKDLAWEIIIVDGGSTDRSIDIAEEFGAKIKHTINQPNFHINKNKAIDAAKGDWVLQLDADEVVSQPLRDEIKKEIEDKNYNGYWIPRKNFFLGKFLTKGGQYPDYTLRLYRRGKGRLPAKDVHEQAVVEGKAGYLKNNLLHMRDKTFAIYLDRFKRYTDLLAFQLKEKSIKITPFSFVNYIFLKPFFWFIKAYIRHKGYVDGFAGFVFALFSSLRFPVSFLKLWRRYEDRI